MAARDDLYQYVESRRKLQPQAEDEYGENNFAALLMDSAAKVGSLDGQQADSSAMRTYADRQNQALDKKYGIDPKIYQYLSDKSKNETEETRLSDTAKRADKKLAQEHSLATMKDQREREQNAAKRDFDERQLTATTDANKLKAQELRDNKSLARENRVADHNRSLQEKLDAEKRDAARKTAEHNEKRAYEEAEKEKEVMTRFNKLKANVAEMKKMVVADGTYEVMGSHNADLKRLMYDIATDYAKLNDPSTAAMSGEVQTAMTNLLPFIKDPFSVSNDTAETLLDNFDAGLERSLVARQAGRKGERMAIESPKKDGFETSAQAAPAPAASAPIGAIKMTPKGKLKKVAEGKWEEVP